MGERGVGHQAGRHSLRPAIRSRWLRSRPLQLQTWMPINENSGFYKFAQANKLGDPQSDEFEFTVDDAYLGQVYQNGLVYAKKSNLGNFQWVKKLDSYKRDSFVARRNK